VKDETIVKVSAIWALTILLIVDAFTWKIDHALWSAVIAAISGLAGYQVGISKGNANKDE